MTFDLSTVVDAMATHDVTIEHQQGDYRGGRWVQSGVTNVTARGQFTPIEGEQLERALPGQVPAATFRLIISAAIEVDAIDTQNGRPPDVVVIAAGPDAGRYQVEAVQIYAAGNFRACKLRREEP